MYVEYHADGGVVCLGVWVRDGVVEKPEGVCVHFLYAFRLLRGDGTKGGEHGWVDRDGIVEERPQDLLH